MDFLNDEHDANDGVLSEINMIPLIDIMLVLLIVFIITAPVMHHALKVDLPDGTSAPQEMKPETVQIGIDSQGQYMWNNEYIDEELLKEKMQQAALLSPQPEVHLSGDRNVRYEAVMHVMNIAQQTSLTKIGFITTPNP